MQGILILGFYSLLKVSCVLQLGSVMENDNKAFSIAVSSSKILALFPLYECKDVSQTTVSVSGSCGREEDVLLVTVRVRKWENRKEVLRCCQSSA